MTGNEIRRKYLNFFEKHNHRIVRSSSLVPADDPTLLFTNAGMVQFKRCFLGEEKRDYNRAVTAQKCVRAGGKHNDLENVGYTARHHTFFEMMGNFSFGDYFKEKALEFAWDLLVNGYGLSEDKLWVSIYLDDDEAFELWNKNIGVPRDKIVRLGEEDNFWSMGDTGPCGPCSEIHLDRGPEYGCDRPDCAVGCDCDRYLEIWNLVFMQFDRDPSGKMTPLPKPSIDTGLGLERMALILQNVNSNYETDLIQPIMAKAALLSGKEIGVSFETDVALKVIADHSRAAAFLIGDGIMPSNEGRGYVLRRIMRRAIRYGRHIGLQKPFLHETAKTVFDIMQNAYPDLAAAEAFIRNVIKNEEVRFSETLDYGLKLLNESLAEIKAQGKKTVPGAIIFKLYDTYGFPVDIVRDVVRDEKLELDIDGFDKAMDRQRAQSRSVTTFASVGEAYKTLSSQGVKSEFTGYEQSSCESEVLVLVVDGNAVSEARQGQKIEIVTAATPFYAESGGQMGDTGQITGNDPNMKFRMRVDDTVKDPTGLIIHQGEVLEGHVRKGDVVTLSINENSRQATRCNHTATHLLHYALREIVGDHVKQAGSKVSSDRLRFDFTHFAQLPRKTLDEIEVLVNLQVQRNFPVQTREMNAEEAFKSGATALFEEKYGDWVRVVSIDTFSSELCGGTHASRTGDIGVFKITGESAVASGVRRIEALTGGAALADTQQTSRMVSAASRLLKSAPATLETRIEKLLDGQKALEKDVIQLKAQLASREAEDAMAAFKTVNDIPVLALKVAATRPAELRELADRFKDRIKSGIVVLGAVSGGKVLLIAVVSKDLAQRCHAGKLIKQVAATVGGGGGGRPDMAQAGGSYPEKLDMALAGVYDIVAGM